MMLELVSTSTACVEKEKTYRNSTASLWMMPLSASLSQFTSCKSFRNWSTKIDWKMFIGEQQFSVDITVSGLKVLVFMIALFSSAQPCTWSTSKTSKHEEIFAFVSDSVKSFSHPDADAIDFCRLRKKCNLMKLFLFAAENCSQ